MAGVEMDGVMIQGISTAVAGLSLSIGALWWTETRAVSSLDRIGDDQMTKLQVSLLALS
jgi:uncharacterized membrane protein YhfC